MEHRRHPLIAVALVLLAACGAKPPEPPVQPPVALRGTYWKLVELGGASIPAAQDRQREPSLVFAAAEDRVSGHGGCNRFSGGFTLAGQGLSFAPLAATRMACAEGGEIEAGFMMGLAGVSAYRVEGATLELRDAGGGLVARFEKAEPPAP